MKTEEKIRVLLGKRIDSKVAEDNIDHAVKRFLKRAWRIRRRVTREVEKAVCKKGGRVGLT